MHFLHFQQPEGHSGSLSQCSLEQSSIRQSWLVSGFTCQLDRCFSKGLPSLTLTCASAVRSTLFWEPHAWVRTRVCRCPELLSRTGFSGLGLAASAPHKWRSRTRPTLLPGTRLQSSKTKVHAARLPPSACANRAWAYRYQKALRSANTRRTTSPRGLSFTFKIIWELSF